MTRGTKVINQIIYSPILYGGENAGDDLTLDASISSAKGPVRINGSMLELTIASQIAQIIHTNTAPRLYSLPDNSGTLFCSGYFTAANQLVTSSSAGVFQIISTMNAAVLVTTSYGTINWATGNNGQFLGISGGVPAFYNLPNYGVITSGAGNTLPIYQTPGPSQNLTPLTTVNGRALLSTPTIAWALITAPFLSGAGGTPLTVGNASQVLASLGDGTFQWINANASTVQPSNQYYLPYYSDPNGGTKVTGSSFIKTDEIVRALSVGSQGRLRFYPATGTNFVEFRSASSLSTSTTFILPTQDAVTAGSSLVSDAAGNLSFVYIDNGSVAGGTANQLSYYAANGNHVQGLSTTSNRVFLSPSGSLTWALITAPYLSTTGGIPLGTGTPNQVLTSDGAGNFVWTSAASISGQVNSGQATYVAYYPATGNAVDDSAFLSIDETNKYLNLNNGGAVNFYDGSNVVSLKAPTLTLSLSLTLPAADGTNGQVLSTDGSGHTSFITVGRGIVDSGTANTFAYYPAASAEVASFPNTALMVAVTNGANSVAWSLLTANYLSTSGSTALANGDAGNVLISDGAGNFQWADAASLVGKIDTGTVNHISYYSAATTLDSSGFVTVDESNKILNLTGSLRLTHSANYIQLNTPVLSSNTTYTLPATDAAASGYVLSSNASGSLSWQNQVEVGTTNALAFYQGTSRYVKPTTNVTIDSSGFTVNGSSFALTGTTSSNPTALTIKAGSGTAANNGASLTLRSGGSGSGTAGTVNIGVNTSDILTVASFAVSLLNNTPLRFVDVSGYYAAFVPASMTASMTWKLPNADGAANQVLSTDGAGNLGWSTSSGTVATGTSGKFAVYTDTNTVGSSPIIAPSTTPIVANSGVVVGTDGTMSYQMLVKDSGTAGQVAIYTAGQTVGYDANFYYLANALELRNNGSLHLFDSASDYVSLKAPTSTVTYSLTLPAAPPTANGQTIAVSTSGVMSFIDSSSNLSTQQKGNIVAGAGVEQVTVLFETPFATRPEAVFAQWAMTNTDLPAFLPTVAIDQVTFEGFVIQFSTATPLSGNPYTLYWEAYQNGTLTMTSNVYFCGCDGITGITNALVYFSMDLDTTVVTSTLFLGTIAYAAAASSSTQGKVLGGQTDNTPTYTSQIQEYTYSTGVWTLAATGMPHALSGAGCVGNRTQAFIAGGQDSVGPLNSVFKLIHATNVVVPSSAVLTNTAVRRGACNSNTRGFVVAVTPDSVVESIDLTTEAHSVTTNFGTPNIQVGCNDTFANIGYFAKGTGVLYSYDMTTDTAAIVTTANLLSSSGIAGAGNSMRRGYFMGSALLEAFEFRTTTMSASNSTLSDTYQASSSSAFQSGGLL